jgi:tol-pal system protein YbgF
MMKDGLMKIFVLAAVIAGSQLSGCTKAEDSSADTIKELQKQVMQLKVENSNLHARTQALDDKLLVFEKKEESERGSSRQAKLKTVRLTPSLRSHERMPYVEQIADEISFASAATEKHRSRSTHKRSLAEENRPVLKLVGSSYSSAQVSRGGDSYSSAKTKPVKFSDIAPVGRGDNLGVMKSNGFAGMDGVALDSAGQNDPMEIFNSAYRAYNNGEFSAALAGFSRFLKSGADHSYADNALFWRGECFLAQGKTVKAIGEFERLLRRYPSSEKAASSLYKIGYIYDQLNDKQKAGNYYFKVVERYPNTASARKASKRMAGNNQTSGLIRTSVKR